MQNGLKANSCHYLSLLLRCDFNKLASVLSRVLFYSSPIVPTFDTRQNMSQKYSDTHYWNTSVESSQYSTIFFFHARLKHAQLESFHTIVVQHSPETFLHTSETTQNMTKMLSYLNETFIRLMPLKLGHAPENVLIHKIETEVIFFFLLRPGVGFKSAIWRKFFRVYFLVGPAH